MLVAGIGPSSTPYFQAPSPGAPPPNWDDLLPNYLQLGVECSSNPNDSELRTDFEKQFRTLRDLRATSFVPFYPIFLFHLNIMDDVTLRRFLEEGRMCDNHLTYTFCLHCLTKELQSSSQSTLTKERIVEIFKILREFYPEDTLLPAMIETVSSGANTFVLKYPQASKHLENSLCSLAKKDIPAALRQLKRNSKTTPGLPFFQPWLALACALHGRPASARIALERMSTSLNQSFFSPYVQNILVSFIDIRGQQDFVCYNAANNPYSRQIESFISMMESKPFNLKHAVEFLEASTQALGTMPESFIFLYFGLQHLLDNVDKYEPELESLYQTIYTLTKATLVYCCESKDPHPWILENFKASRTEKGFLFSIPTAEEVKQIASLVPSFKFDQKFGISAESHYSLAAAITNQGCRLMGKIFELSLATKGLEINLPLPIPEKHSLEGYCSHALLADEPFAFYTALNYLRNYFELPDDARPYELSAEFLNWAKFLIFASAPPNTLNTNLDAQIRAAYYPEQLTHKQSLTLSERDTLLAKFDLERRTTEPPGTIPADADYYTLYLHSKHYFHWRPNETLQEWGKRLKTKAYPPHPFFDIFHRFWTKFHQQIVTHGSRTKIQIPQAVAEKLKEKLKESAKKTSPIPIGVKPRQSPVRCVRVPRAALASKMADAKKIKPLILKKPQDMSDVNLEAAAAALLDKAEDELVSAVSLKGQPQALDLCRLVLEASVDRLVRRAFSVERSDALKSTLYLYLNQLVGSLTYSPEQRRYRIGVATQCGIVRNSHIYIKN